MKKKQIEFIIRETHKKTQESECERILKLLGDRHRGWKIIFDSWIKTMETMKKDFEDLKNFNLELKKEIGEMP